MSAPNSNASAWYRFARVWHWIGRAAQSKFYVPPTMSSAAYSRYVKSPPHRQLPRKGALS